MSYAKEKDKYTLYVYVAAAVFLVCTAVGVALPMKFARLGGGEIENMLKNGLCKTPGFGEVFKNALGGDFGFCCTVMVLAISTYTSFLPLAVISFHGFCTGFAVAVMSRCVSASAMCAVSTMLVVRNALCVPIYVILYLLGIRCSRKMTDSSLHAGERVRNYATFTLWVAVMFAVLCILDLVQAGVWCVVGGLVRL